MSYGVSSSMYFSIFCMLSIWGRFLEGHGFGADVYVKMVQGWERIEQVAQNTEGEIQYVVSCNPTSRVCSSRRVRSRARSTTNCYFKCGLDTCSADDIVCTSLQEFYLPEEKSWVPACQLKVGDFLLTEFGGALPILSMELVNVPIEVYAIEVEDTHTFFVGRNAVLTHNMIIPAAALCWEIPATTATLMSTVGGCCAGLTGVVGGVVIGGVAVSLVYSWIQDSKIAHYDANDSTVDANMYRQTQGNSKRTRNNKKSGQGPSGPQKPDDPKPRFTEKVANMNMLFALNEFGRQLCECSERTKFLYENHATIFRVIRDSIQYNLKRGYWFYLDTLHYDHIEVFNKSGTRCVAVLNLDGSYNAIKTAQAIKDCRDIVEYIN